VELVIESRFCGPPESGNGGWVCGRVSEALRSDDEPFIEVRLHTPPPLERTLTLTTADGIATLTDRDQTVATARAAPGFTSEVPPAVTWDEAQQAAAAYEGRTEHPFPTCFTCGTRRTPGDALRLQPGPVPGHPGTYAAPWQPTESTLPITWAALDCPGGWATGFSGRPCVLGTMTARVDSVPTIGERYVVTAQARGQDGRKLFSASALYTTDGYLLARAEATWIAVDPAAIRPAP
jgi:hypothetical protein